VIKGQERFAMAASGNVGCVWFFPQLGKKKQQKKKYRKILFDGN